MLDPENKLKLSKYKLTRQEQYDDDIHELRKKYLPKIYSLIILWFAFIILGFTTYTIGIFLLEMHTKFYVQILPGYVIVAFLTTSTANIIGLFVVCARWLYPQNKKIKEEQDY